MNREESRASMFLPVRGEIHVEGFECKGTMSLLEMNTTFPHDHVCRMPWFHPLSTWFQKKGEISGNRALPRAWLHGNDINFWMPCSSARLTLWTTWGISALSCKPTPKIPPGSVRFFMTTASMRSGMVPSKAPPSITFARIKSCCCFRETDADTEWSIAVSWLAGCGADARASRSQRCQRLWPSGCAGPLAFHLSAICGKVSLPLEDLFTIAGCDWGGMFCLDARNSWRACCPAPDPSLGGEEALPVPPGILCKDFWLNGSDPELIANIPKGTGLATFVNWLAQTGRVPSHTKFLLNPKKSDQSLVCLEQWSKSASESDRVFRGQREGGFCTERREHWQIPPYIFLKRRSSIACRARNLLEEVGK